MPRKPLQKKKVAKSPRKYNNSYTRPAKRQKVARDDPMDTSESSAPRQYYKPRGVSTNTYKQYQNTNNVAGYGIRANSQVLQFMESKIRFSPETYRFVHQILDPEENCRDPLRWPEVIGGSSTLSSKTVIEAEIANDGATSVVVRPQIVSAITCTTRKQVTVKCETTNATGFSIYQPVRGLPNKEYFLDSPVSWASDIIQYPTNRIGQAGNEETLEKIYWMSLHLNKTAADLLAAATTGTALTGNVITLRYLWSSPIDVTGVTVRVRVYNGNGQQVGSIATDSIVTPGYNDVGILSGEQIKNCVLPTANADGASTSIGFSVSITSGKALTGSFVGNFLYLSANSNSAIGNAAMTFYNQPTHNVHKVVQLTDAETIFAQAGSAFVMAQSMLMTSNNSSDTNSGVIASCRMPAGKTIGGPSLTYSGAYATIGSSPYASIGNVLTPDWYSFMGSLAYNTFDGPQRNGTYTWYLGRDKQSYNWKNISAPNLQSLEENYMAGIATLNQVATIRIKVFTLIAFTTSNSLYDVEIPPVIPDYQVCLQLLGLCESSYENESHGRQIKEYLKRGAKTIGNKALAIARNPENWVTASKVVGNLLDAIIPL